MVVLIGCNSDINQNQATKNNESLNKKTENIMNADAKATLDIAMNFMDAMGKGEMENMMALMHDDMVWQNAGDPNVPWIGPWNGKKAILEDFMPKFGAGFKTIKWEPNDAFAKGNTAAFFGQMIGELNKSGEQTKEFTYAL